MSDDEYSSEDEVDQTLSNSEVIVKYKSAAQIANKVMTLLISQATHGKNILELCDLGDKTILDEVKPLYKNHKNLEKGVAFPTCISVNNVAGHYSPEAEDKAALNTGDVVKIDLGVHLDGFIALIAHTLVVGDSQAAPTTGKAADVICAAAIAADAVLRLLKPGTKNTVIPPVIKKIAEIFHVQPVEAVLSHQMKRFVIDGTKVIPNKVVADQNVEEYEIQENDVYAIDVVMSTGEGKTKELALRPTIYKRAVDQNYQLKLQAARKVYSEIDAKFAALPFTVRALEDKHCRYGLGELEKHGLIHPYPVLYEKQGELVAQFKFTALVGASGALKITEQPLPYVQSQYSVEDPEIKTLLAQAPVTSLKKKSKKKSSKKSKKPKTEKAPSEAAPMDTA